MTEKRLPQKRVICPGEILAVWFQANSSFPKDRCCLIYQIPEVTLNAVLAGKHELDMLVISKIARMTNIPETEWIKLERKYRADLAAGHPHLHGTEMPR